MQGYATTIADARVRTILDVEPFIADIGMIFPDAPKEKVEAHRHWLEPVHLRGNELTMVVQTYILEIDGRIILVDTCVGEHKARPARPALNMRKDTGFLDRLAAAGIKPEQVDVVMCTHLHHDHVGWNTQMRDGRWVPTFPKARYVTGRKEMDYWKSVQPRETASNGCIADSVMPVVDAGQFDIVDDGHELGRGLTLQPLYGHTPGQMGLRLERGGSRALFCGDAIHTPLQLGCPELSTAFDSDKDAARLTRAEMLAAVADSGTTLLPAHFRGGCGWKITRKGDGYRLA